MKRDIKKKLNELMNYNGKQFSGDFSMNLDMFIDSYKNDDPLIIESLKILPNGSFLTFYDQKDNMRVLLSNNGEEIYKLCGHFDKPDECQFTVASEFIDLSIDEIFHLDEIKCTEFYKKFNKFYSYYSSNKTNIYHL